jgi:hypothetical protein
MLSCFFGLKKKEFAAQELIVASSWQTRAIELGKKPGWREGG